MQRVNNITYVCNTFLKGQLRKYILKFIHGFQDKNDTINLGLHFRNRQYYSKSLSFNKCNWKNASFVFSKTCRTTFLVPYLTFDHMNIPWYLTGFHFLKTQCITRYRFLNFGLSFMQLTISHHKIGFHFEKIEYPEENKILFLHFPSHYLHLSQINF